MLKEITLFIVLSLLSLEVFSNDIDKKIVEDYKGAVVRVETSDEQFLGTGFFFNTKGYILTAAHILKLNGEDLIEVKIRNYTKVIQSKDSTSVNKEVVLLCDVDYVFPEIDMAILQVRNSTHTFERFPYSLLNYSNHIYEGQSVGICAFIPDKFEKAKAFISSGVVSTIRKKEYIPFLEKVLDFIQSDLNIARGTSGGPIFELKTGRVIAMQTGGMYLDKSIHTPYSIGILIDQIFPKLDSLGIAYDVK